ncbi:hypothetical protein EMO89_09295 [Bifidobacterium tissieri]|uniref:Tetrapyrrole biosynthesis uroporphyrinogen III synthase domain-containing protein n=1 Tax=Bifidobacterium tissieri TaxID=1630162 RepID=A0A5M9ZLA3_9BIFI|nr:hypothetical protein [Bifidobacterium tissieri]KAA8828354.1 hypothetical protein EMO89_09295 [Bifidobacterium tissieri]
MTVLITYPRRSVPEDLRARLEQAAPISPIYLPLRHLRAVPLSSQDRRRIARSAYLVVTSHFALTTLIDLLPALVPAWQGALIVLSHKMEAVARDAGIMHVLVPDEENHRGLDRLLAALPPHMGGAGVGDGDDVRDAVVGDAVGGVIELCGNLHVPDDHTRIPITSVGPTSVPRICIYDNAWDETDERNAVRSIRQTVAAERSDDAGTCERDQQIVHRMRIDRVLVTSPSAYQRLQRIIAATPESFIDELTYYVLGPSTAHTIEADGNAVICPRTNTDVLRRILDRMLRDLAGRPQG